MKAKNWFEVSKEGLKELQAGKPKHYIIRELVQNAWDEDITYCEVKLDYKDRQAEIKVSDDSPEGFRDLTDAFTLFKPTYKRTDPNKRGRFNVGEKQAIALASRARITTTKGTIIFDKDGRRNARDKRTSGSEVILWVKMTPDEYDAIFEMLKRYIPPEGIRFVANGITYPVRKPEKTITASLETEFEKGGAMRRGQRKTEVRIYRKTDDKAMLYEMGIPICEIDCQFDIGIQQRVPLSIDREAVSQKYLSNLYAEVLNETYDRIEKENSSDLWVREAMSNKRIKKEAVKNLIEKRFGEKACVANPFDRNSIDEAISRGYNLIYGSELSEGEWANIRENEALNSSTELFGKGFTGAEIIEPNEKMLAVANLAKKIAKRLLGIDLVVGFYKSEATCGADFSDNHLNFNASRLPKSFWEKSVSKETINLILHELAHSRGNHTEMEYHECLTDMAAKLIIIALEEPEFFN